MLKIGKLEDMHSMGGQTQTLNNIQDAKPFYTTQIIRITVNEIDPKIKNFMSNLKETTHELRCIWRKIIKNLFSVFSIVGMAELN